MTDAPFLRRLKRYAIWLALSLPLAVWAETCQIDTPSPLIQSYDPSVSYRTTYAAVLRIRAITDCTVRLQLDRLEGTGELKLTSTDAAGLRVLLSQDAAAATPIQAAPFDIASWRLLAGQSVSYAIWINPVPQQWSGAGLYQAPLRVRLLDVSGNTLDERDWVISVKSQATAKVAFTGSSSQSARLDFGEISAGAKRTADLEVWSNTPYQISMTSQNRGYLQNKQLKSQAPDVQIAYTVRLSGQALAIQSGQASITALGNGHSRHPLEVTLGTVDRLLAGEYGDNLLITVTAQ